MLQMPPCHPPALARLGNAPEELKNLLRDYTISALNKRKGELKPDLRQIDEAGLIEALSKIGWSKTDDTDADPPFAIRQKSAAGDVVITLNQFEAGMLAIRGGLIIIQAVRKENGAYVLADQTGDDLFGIGVSKFQVLAHDEGDTYNVCGPNAPQ